MQPFSYFRFVSMCCAVLRCFINSTLLSLSFQSGVSFAHELRAFHPCRIYTCIHGSIQIVVDNFDTFISSTSHEIFCNFDGTIMRLDYYIHVILSAISIIFGRFVMST